MKRVAQFEKVSFQQYRRDLYELIKAAENTGTIYLGEIGESYDNIILPKRSTTGSAGYDFYLPFKKIKLNVGESISIPTGIRCAMDDDWMLQIYPRSGHGFKHGIHLANTVGIVDSDYYFADNEGHIHVKLVNDSALAKDIEFEHGTAFCQGVFVPYGITVDDDADGVRHGGFGSTDK